MSSGKGIHQKSKKLLSKLAFIQQCFHIPNPFCVFKFDFIFIYKNNNDNKK